MKVKTIKIIWSLWCFITFCVSLIGVGMIVNQLQEKYTFATHGYFFVSISIFFLSIFICLAVIFILFFLHYWDLV
ncbi:hypothetical protein D4R86_01910 [bacterium]|nr:MAG: hypothetical protein D4R86_01910 [bacterium]